MSTNPTINNTGLDTKTLLSALISGMKTANSPSTAPPPEPAESASNSDTRNAAVATCCEAYNKALRDAAEKKLTNSQCETRAERAYRQAMPHLSRRENIRDFIACVAHGMLIRAIRLDEGTKLLYAAQVAYTASELPSTSIRQPCRPRNQPMDVAPETGS